MRTDRVGRGAAAAVAMAIGVLLASVAGAGGHHGLYARGAEVWAVGDSGRVYRSYDHGASFAVSALGQRTLRAVSASGLRVFVVGDSGKIWRSEDWGGTWNLTVLPGAPDLFAVATPTAETAYVGGASGGIWKTTNGGGNWTPQSSGTPGRVHALDFTDADHGWLVGAQGYAAVTTNGGATWSPVATGTTRDLLDVDVRGNRVWLVGARGVARRSTTGGAPFTALDLKLDAQPDVRAVHLAGADSVFLAGGGGFLWRSADDGATWAHLEHPLHGAISDMTFVPGAAWVASSRHRGLIRTASPQGFNWALAGTGASLSRSWVQKLSVGSTVRGATLTLNPQNPRTMYAMLGVQLYVSRDEGETWTAHGNPVPGPTSVKTNAIVMSPKDSLVIVAAVGTPDRIVRSEDGGVTWTDQYTDDFGEYGIPLEMDPDRPDTLYFGVDNDAMRRSTDFGKTWGPWSSTVFRSPCDIVVVPGADSLVLLVGDGITSSGQGKHWRSNGGTAFALIDSVTGSEIPGLATSRLKSTAAFGTAWGTGGVKRTLNRGLTWQTVATNNNAWGIDVCREDPNVVMFGVYSGGLSWLSTTGGGTGSWGASSMTGANYSFLLADRGTFIAEQSNGLWKMAFTYTFPLATGAQSLSLTAPDGGETWPAGSVRTITWNAQQVALARIEWRATPAGSWQHVADVEGSAGRYDWVVPAVATNSARVRVRDAWDNVPEDTSSGAFTIATAAIAATPAPLSFGPVLAGGARRLTLTIANAGNAALDVSSIVASDPAFHPGRTSLSVAAGAEDTVGVWFEPGTFATFDDTLWLASNATGAPQTAVALSGSGASGEAPPWTPSPDPFDYGPAALTHATYRALSLSNTSAVALVVSWIEGAGDFTPVRRSFTVAPFTTDTVGILYAPIEVGPDTATLVFTTNEPGHPRTLVATGYGSAETEVDDPPVAFALDQAHPNPLSIATRIRFALPSRAHVVLEVFDVRGERVATLLDEPREAGSHSVSFRPAERRLGAGMYFYRLNAGGLTATRKMLVLR